MMKNLLLCTVMIFVLLGCGKRVQDQPSGSSGTQAGQSSPAQPSAPVPEAEDNPSFRPLPIYTDKGSNDNHYVPSGFMPNGNCVTMEDGWTQDCQSGKTCIKIVYDLECSQQDQKWAGIYWLNPANNWGKRKGGFDLSGAEKLTFWAKGEKGGERIEEFTVGGITGDFPDSDVAIIGPVILTNEWTEYSMDLRGKDLSYISGGFAWATNVEANPEKSCTFYLDHIRYE